MTSPSCIQTRHRDHHGTPTQTRRLPPYLRIEPGEVDDYRALAVFHYRSGAPAGIDRVLRLIDRSARGADRLAGVLVVSYPALWCTWRWTVWPTIFQRGNLSKDAREINRRLRMIARVIIEPRYRGLGAAVALVQGYLRDPSTPLTAAISAMGRCCPLFNSAGMTPHALPPSPRDVQLAAFLASRRIKPWRLVDLPAATRAVRDGAVADALTGWHLRQRGTARRRRRELTLPEIAMLAGSHLTARPIVYTHGGEARCHPSREEAQIRPSKVPTSPSLSAVKTV